MIQETENLRTGWLVHQISQRGWVATKFTHLNVEYEDTIKIIGPANSVVVGDALENLGACSMRAVQTNASLRNYMYNILKTGRFE